MTGEPLDAIVLGRGPAARRVRLRDYLDPQLESAAIASEYAWIKRLRHLTVDEQPLRRRFSLRGDSLWWFAELYLHKQQAILGLFRTIAAIERLIERERPSEMSIDGGHRLLRGLAGQVAAARGIPCRNAPGFGGSRVRLFRMDWRARGLTLAATASRARRKARAFGDQPQPVAAFVHRAFWRADASDGSAESYIGPVLAALEATPDVAVQYVGVGPRENFRARRWWHALGPGRPRGARNSD